VSTFGDDDPEDAYDAGDPPEIRLLVLSRVFAHVRDHEPDLERAARRHLAALVLLAGVLSELIDALPPG
jgi:hypothetical protein